MKKRLLLFALMLSAFTIGVCSCRAWRTVTTTATCVQTTDSTDCKTSTTITTKTVEDWQGKKK